jgi:hypothetical protein
MWRRAISGVGVATAMLLAGCGGDDSGASQDTAASEPDSDASTTTTTTVVGGGTTADDRTTPETTSQAPDASSGGTRAVLPDACDLIDDATAAAAMGGAGTSTSPQPPTDISARCEWTSGTRTISLLVRQGPNAESDFDNATEGFVPVQFSEAEAQVLLGVDEKDRDYRLVTLLAYDGQYYVSVTLQGPSRDDAPATQAAASLVQAALVNLQG